MRRSSAWMNVFKGLGGLGIALFVTGGAGDLAYHLAPHARELQFLVGPDGSTAHVVTVVGMVLSLVGLLGGLFFEQVMCESKSLKKE